MALTLGEIAAALGAELRGDPGLAIQGAAPLDQAGPSHISFFANAKYADQLAATGAGAVLLTAQEALRAPQGTAVLVSRNPYRDFAVAVGRWFDPRPRPAPGIHASAVVAPDARVDPTAHVGALAVIGAGCVIGPRSAVHAQAHVGPGCRIGADCVLHPTAVLYDGCRLGDRVIIHAGAVLGADGFGFAPDPPNGYVKVPQIGWVEIQDDVEIQANACVDRGALGATLIKRGAKLDNLVQIAHNVEVGEHTVIAAQSAVSGSTKLGRWVTMAGQSATAGHLTVGDQAVITGQAGAGKDVPAKAMVSGSPAQPMLEHHRGLAELNRLPELKKRVKALEARLARMEGQGPATG
jgi:UDP-3-O-[3-hydroxymyristoyl] glucosamine N-acyltransferase